LNITLELISLRANLALVVRFEAFIPADVEDSCGAES
jgi:hypothetical protein